MTQLEQLFEDVFNEGNLIKGVFSAKRKKAIEYNKITVRPIMLGATLQYQAEYVYDKKVIHKNFPPEQAGSLCRLFMEDFKQANIFTNSHDIQILAANPDKPRITKKPSTLTCRDFLHNRRKKYIIADGIPCDFLMRLGVMDKEGKVIPKHYNKFRQINRYLEIVEDVFPHLASDDETKGTSMERPLRIIDFGCGKAYLTFAIYYYLKILKKRNVEIIGLDLKSDVIDFCNKVASDLHYDELKFIKGDIADYTNDYADMVVTLHACDTATDYAIINAVAWNTKVILSVPCCQHELFKQINNRIHQPMLKHGILKDRLTEYLTDGLRGLKLESKGYTVSMIEFTSLEHTSRNIMIKAVKNHDLESPLCQKALAEYEALKSFYNVNPTIDKL